jgi:RNA polymerase sigma-70 factor (ECF subfamily)
VSGTGGQVHTNEGALLERARGGDEAAFGGLVDRYSGELKLHCYRIVGSVQDAEDLVQETLLAAWRGLDRFEGRASLSTWLYRIATNRCLNALRDGGRRPRAPGESPEGTPVPPQPTRLRDPVWLEPYPDTLLDSLVDRSPQPGARYETREAIGLAFMVALQRLPPRQRAVLVLRDVLGFRAREVAVMLDTSEVAVNRALQRARAAIDRTASSAGREAAPLPGSREERELVARFTASFEAGDIPGVLALLAHDAVLTMPPEPLEYEGPHAIGAFLSTVPAGGALERFRLVPTRANGQPAFGCYLRDPRAPIRHAYGLMVLTLSGDHIAAITGFPDTSVFRSFGLPRTLPE